MSTNPSHLRNSSNLADDHPHHATEGVHQRTETPKPEIPVFSTGLASTASACATIPVHTTRFRVRFVVS
jgi:hypothetical protein